MDWGNQRMRYAIKCFGSHAPFVNQLCALLEKSMYDPIKQGHELAIRQMDNSTSMPSMDRIQQAIREAQASNTLQAAELNEIMAMIDDVEMN